MLLVVHPQASQTLYPPPAALPVLSARLTHLSGLAQLVLLPGRLPDLLLSGLGQDIYPPALYQPLLRFGIP